MSSTSRRHASHVDTLKDFHPHDAPGNHDAVNVIDVGGRTNKKYDVPLNDTTRGTWETIPPGSPGVALALHLFASLVSF